MRCGVAEPAAACGRVRAGHRGQCGRRLAAERRLGGRKAARYGA